MTSGGGPDAFTFVVVAYDLPERIESVCPWQDRVYVGLADGSLIVLEPEFELHEDGPWSVERHVKGVGKKAITHMEPAPSLSSLFVLSSSGLQLLKLPELDVVPQVRTVHHRRGFLGDIVQVTVSGSPFRFAWNDAKALLCVAVRKTLVFYALEDMSLIETNTVVIPDTLRIMAWCGDRLCYGSYLIRTEYRSI